MCYLWSIFWQFRSFGEVWFMCRATWGCQTTIEMPLCHLDHIECKHSSHTEVKMRAENSIRAVIVMASTECAVPELGSGDVSKSIISKCLLYQQLTWLLFIIFFVGKSLWISMKCTSTRTFSSYSFTYYKSYHCSSINM